MIEIDVGVAHDVGEAARHEVADVGEHVRQQRVAGDVEGDAETHVARPLVQLAMQMPLGLAGAREGHVELGKHVAGGQGHAAEVAGVPGGDYDAAIVGRRAQLVDDVGELVDALPRVVGVEIDVVGAKVTPLETVDGPKVADLAMGQADAVQEFARAVAVPNLDAGFAQGQRRRVALDEPQQLGDDGFEEDALGGQEREDRNSILVEREAQGPRSKDGVGPRAGAARRSTSGASRGEGGETIGEGASPIGSMLAMVENLAHEVEVLVFLVHRGRFLSGMWKRGGRRRRVVGDALSGSVAGAPPWRGGVRRGLG